MDNENKRYGAGEQQTRKFNAVSDADLMSVRDTDGVYIGERPVYGQKTPRSAPAVQQSARQPSRPADRIKSGTASGKTGKKKNTEAKKEKNKRAGKKKSAQQIAARRRKGGFAFAFLSIVICISVICSIFLISCMNDILAMNRSKEKISVSVNQSMTTNQVIDVLGDKDLIKNPWFCKLVAKFLGYDDTEYLTSVYALPPSYGLEKMLQTMSSSRVGSETVKLIFPEGYSIEQIFAKLEEFDVCSAESLRATARQMDFSEDFPFLKNIPNRNERYYYLEGYLYPDTYEFYVGENATSVITRFLKNFENHWTDEFSERAAELNMTMDEIVTLASVIEKEAYGTSQMYQISSVLHNRLNDRSGGFMYLQCDSTSRYISGIPENVLAGNDRVNFTKLYDTYQSTGLPAGAICSPGGNAIKSALYPDDTGYFYFRHDVNKKIYLAETKRGHDRNGEEVLRVNAAANEG